MAARSYGRRHRAKFMVDGLSPLNFTPTRKIVGVDHLSGISFDDSARRVCVVAETEKDIRRRILNYSDILSAEIYENGMSVTRTARASQLAGTVIGALALGGVGAVIGGLSGKREARSKTTDIQLRLLVNDPGHPYYDIAFLSHKAGADQNAAERAMKLARDALGFIELIIRRSDANVGDLRPTPRESPSPSLADELKKFADLRASGTLTEDEFQTQKRRLLESKE